MSGYLVMLFGLANDLAVLLSNALGMTLPYLSKHLKLDISVLSTIRHFELQY